MTIPFLVLKPYHFSPVFTLLAEGRIFLRVGHRWEKNLVLMTISVNIDARYQMISFRQIDNIQIANIVIRRY